MGTTARQYILKMITRYKRYEEDDMKIAIPVVNGVLNTHFGHCKEFVFIEADRESKEIVKEDTVAAPPHEPGLLPHWLSQRGVTMVIAGGMGQRAQGLFSEEGIEVVVGAPAEDPKTLVLQYLAGNLVTGDNACDH